MSRDDDRDDDRVDFGIRLPPGHADRLDDAHPGAYEVVREIGRAREVVGDTAEK